MAKAAAAVAVAPKARRRQLGRIARALLDGAANPDGTGLLLRGREYQPALRGEFDPIVLDGLMRLARLAETVAAALRECPDATVRRSAAVLAARAHPIRAAFDD